MASSGERRLLFDTRGRRKHVIRVVYAILAVLMGASLFLVVGPVNLGALLGNSSNGGSSTKLFHEQAERIEGRLAQSPRDAQLLLALTRARINAGNSQIEVTSETEPAPVSLEAHKDFDAASEAWSRYLKQTDEPSSSAAQLVSGTFFRLAESGSGTLAEVEENISLAARAQRIAAERQPSLGALSTLAIYEYFTGNFAAGDKATKAAAAKAGAKAEAKNIEKQLGEYRKRAAKFQEGLKKAEKFEKKSGKESLQNPFGGLGGAPLGG
jgi:hypothetical protein